MAKASYKDLIETADEVKTKKGFSDELASIVSLIQESTGPDGTVLININRVGKIIKFPAQVLISTLTSEKSETDSEITAILAKVTIDGK